MKSLPSFMSSTLSIAFIVCVIASVVMVFMWTTPDPITFGIITAVVGAYLSARNPVIDPKEVLIPVQSDYEPSTEQRLEPIE